MEKQARKKKQWLLVTTAFMVLAFGLLFWLHYQTLNRSQALSEKVTRVYEVVNLNNELYMALLSAETNERGYIITGDKKFYTHYNSAKDKISASLVRLKDFAKQPPVQVQRIDTITALVAKRTQLLNRGMVYRNQVETDKAVQLVMGGEGKNLMMRIHASIEDFNTTEVKLLEEQSLLGKTKTSVSFNILFGGATFILVLMMMFYRTRIRLINQLRKTKEELFQRNELFEQTLLSIGDGVISTDANGQIIFMNRVAEKLMGQPLPAAQGKTVENICTLVNEDTLIPIENPVAKTLQTNTPIPLHNHTILINKNEGHYHIEDSVSPLHNHRGDLMGAVMVIRDVTEQSVNTKKLHTAYKKIEDRNKDMVDSINYAKRIQTALLPRLGDFRRIFPESFIFYKPKDIVSGDFFWCYETPTRKYIIMADCTGHGVPGALMSIIGNELLNRIIMEQKVADPARILYMLEDGITGSLKNSGSASDVKDGMDIAVCVLEERKRLHFAGASLSLFLQRKGRNDLTELKGSLFPIGNELDYADKTFDTQTIDVEKGDTIYLSSDGYYSQFGGPHNKKFMRGSFKSLLAGLGGLDMQKRKSLLHVEFERWKGTTTQIDDVMVMGIEI